MSPLAEYQKIPKNDCRLYDLIIRNVQYQADGETRTADLGILRDEVPFNGHRDFFYRSRIQELGDLSDNYGYQELDATGLVGGAGPGAAPNTPERARSETY